MEGTETRMLGGGEDTTGTEMTDTSPFFQEVEGTPSSEENPEVSFSSEEETEMTDQSEAQFEGEGISETLYCLP